MQVVNNRFFDLAQAHLLESSDVKRKTAELCMDSILNAAHLIADTFRSGKKVLLCGNGGSAADCQHMAAELVGRLRKDFERPGLPAIALTTDTSFMTAYSNDCDFDGVFARQVQALGRVGDVLIGISTSGNSPNVISAVETAHLLDMQAITLTGSGGALMDKANIAVAVPSNDTQYIQEAHLAIEHILCAIIEGELFDNKSMK